MGLGDVITGDMGGTSFDVSVIVDGEPLQRVRAEVFGFWTGLVMVDVNSIGAGGGSIAWIDDRGMLRVGPRSAGANPGPAAYGKGGTEATITDALVVLGLLDPAYFLGGRITLAADRAVEAVGRLGSALGMDEAAAAFGIYRVALEQMRAAIKTLLVDKGLDPRRFTLMSYGGCGGLFAAAIAAELGIPRVVVPRLASVFSAYGAATADVRRDLARSHLAAMPAKPAALAGVFDELTAAVRTAVIAEGVDPTRVEVRREADLRFDKQQWEVTVPLLGGPVTEESVARLGADFRARYEALYGRGAALIAAGIELVTCRAVGLGRLGALAGSGVALAVSSPADAGIETLRKGMRRLGASLDRRGPPRKVGSGLAMVNVWDGEGVRSGMRIDGPALIERRDTTIYVPSGMQATVDAFEGLVISTNAGDAPRTRLAADAVAGIA
jgi:N-methylhydantoinase A